MNSDRNTEKGTTRRGFVKEITAGAATDAERVRALEQYLLQNGRYSDTPPIVAADSERSPDRHHRLHGRAFQHRLDLESPH